MRFRVTHDIGWGVVGRYAMAAQFVDMTESLVGRSGGVNESRRCTGRGPHNEIKLPAPALEA